MERSQYANRAVMKIREISDQLHPDRVFIHLEIHREKGAAEIKEIVNTGIIYRVHCNLKKI